eukprot:CAMPEP_0197850338 /NCGR_PEP_ID=MMETSP1438-20131217/15111_1 /TAXON_ID=1461541 /ORGANISM="Pterosperma sp., Strain CCMP1384" /LENGTH=50 /DNA_ID=CAMNT_0043463461 /DNA_START=45 /DNA_END=197 /DNA_ORIENTATION=-
MARPRAFKEAVFPPVLGPVILTASVPSVIEKSTGTGGGMGVWLGLRASEA